MRVAVTGATGFVGHHVVAELVRAGHDVVAVARRGGRSSAASGADLGTHPGVRYIAGDVATGEGLDSAFAGADAAVHLVGIITQAGRQTFARVHVDGTANALGAARRAGVRRFAHMSALGARPDSPAGYARSKADAEALVRASGLEWTVFRPSNIFGVGDDFFGRILRQLVSLPPVVPVIGSGDFPFRPVWVGDVARAFAGALSRPQTAGCTFDLAGPTEHRFEALLDLEMRALGLRKPRLHVPLALMRAAVPIMGALPSPPITRDQFLMLLEGSTADPAPARDAFGLELRELEAELPAILGRPDGRAGTRQPSRPDPTSLERDA